MSSLATETTRIACPDCSHTRKKKNSKDCVVSQKPFGKVYFCHHCGSSGVLDKRLNSVAAIQVKNHSQVKNYLPSKKILDSSLTINRLNQGENMQSASIEHYDFLKTRGISKETADKVGIFAQEKWFNRLNKKADSVAFPYKQNGNVINIKYRSIKGKDFTQDFGGTSILFNIDNIADDKPLVITEGEIDACTLIECGVDQDYGVCSVPTGASMKVSDGKIHPSEDKRFSYIWHSHEKINKVPYVVIATDNDQAGKSLAEELARRIGKDRCHIVDFGKHKDFNELFLDSGKDKVLEILKDAKPYPVEGLQSPAEYKERLNNLRDKGTLRGESTGFTNVDQIYTVLQGQLSVVTGYPSSGKSNFVDQVMVNLAKQSQWKLAVCSFENAPDIHIARLMEIYCEEKFFGEGKMDQAQFDSAFKWVNDHFTFLTHESSEPSTLDSILDRLKISVARTGIRGAVIDPYNYIVLEGDGSETEKISNMLTRVQSFAKSYGVHVWFVAHPSKMQRYGNELPRPDGMSISGSMSWWAKADVGLTVHRQESDTEIICWKSRYRWIGQTGIAELSYNKDTGTYKQADF